MNVRWLVWGAVAVCALVGALSARTEPPLPLGSGGAGTPVFPAVTSIAPCAGRGVDPGFVAMAPPWPGDPGFVAGAGGGIDPGFVAPLLCASPVPGSATPRS